MAAGKRTGTGGADGDDDDPLAHMLAEERSAAALPSQTPDEAAAALAVDFPRCVRLPSLRVLDLSSNQLLSMPPWLPPSLKVLFMSRNTLMSIPDWAATRLTNLQVRMVPTSSLLEIIYFPSRHLSLDPLLPSLQLLDCHGNKISQVSRYDRYSYNLA